MADDSTEKLQHWMPKTITQVAEQKIAEIEEAVGRLTSEKVAEIEALASVLREAFFMDTPTVFDIIRRGGIAVQRDVKTTNHQPHRIDLTERDTWTNGHFDREDWENHDHSWGNIPVQKPGKYRIYMIVEPIEDEA